MLELDKEPGKEEIQVLETALGTFTKECEMVLHLRPTPSKIMLRYLLLVVTLQILAPHVANGAKVCHVVTHSGGEGPVHT